MTKQEFEKIAIRNGEEISQMLYDSIEHLYMSDNNYHEAHGGVDETKQDFVRRVFGGKVNTSKSILKKTIAECRAENRYCLLGCPSVGEQDLLHMDKLIEEHLTFCANFLFG